MGGFPGGPHPHSPAAGGPSNFGGNPAPGPGGHGGFNSPGDHPGNHPSSNNPGGFGPVGGSPMPGGHGQPGNHGPAPDGPRGGHPDQHGNNAPPAGHTSAAGLGTATPPAFTDPGTHADPRGGGPIDRGPDPRGTQPPNQGFAGPGYGQQGGPAPRPAFGPGAMPGPTPGQGLPPRPGAMPGPTQGPTQSPTQSPAPGHSAGPRPDPSQRPDAGPRPEQRPTGPRPDQRPGANTNPSPEALNRPAQPGQAPAPTRPDTQPTPSHPSAEPDVSRSPADPISGDDSDGPTPDADTTNTTDPTPTDPAPPINGDPTDGPPVDDNGVPLNFLGNRQGEHPFADLGDYLPMNGDRANGMGSYDQRVAPLISDHNPWGVHGDRETFNQHHRPDGTYRTNRWPDLDGAVPGSQRAVTLPPGTVLDRFGGEGGRFLSPLDTNGQPHHYGERAIFPDNAEVGYHVYVVDDPGGLPGTLADVAPALGQDGGGRQFTLTDDTTVQRLLDEGVLREVHVPPADGRVLADDFGRDTGAGTQNTDTVTVDDAGNGTDSPPLPDNLQQLADSSAQRTPAGAALFDPADVRTRDAANAVAPIDGHFVMDVHSDGQHAIVNGQRLDGADLADLARHLGWNGTDPIILNGCEAGRHADGLAADLARASGAQVIAPTERSWSGEHNTTPYSTSVDTVDSNGRARPTIPPDGGWRAFDPDGTISDTGSDGLPVDNRPPADPTDGPTPSDPGPEPTDSTTDVDRGLIQSPFVPPAVNNQGNALPIQVNDNAAAAANPNDPHRPLRTGEQLIGRAGLTPNTMYHVPGRGDYYTDGTGTITHADLQVDNRRDSIKETGANANPDAAYPQPNTTYRVDVDGASHIYTTDAAGMPPRYVEWQTPPHTNSVTFPATGPNVPPNSPLARPLGHEEALSDRTGWPPHTEIVHTTPNGTTRLYTGPPDPAAGGTARVVAIDTFSSPSGLAGDRNYEVNNFPPNTVTRIDTENVYVTNDLGVTFHATDERTYGTEAPRSQWSQDRVSALGGAGTDGGHIRPTQADGAPDARNQFPQDSDENRPQKGQPARETWYGQDMEASREQRRRGTDHEWHDFQTEGAHPAHPARPQAVHERFVMTDRNGRIRVHFRRYDN
ncbi:TNT domain-containing protein [Actinophytocola sediminis]